MRASCSETADARAHLLPQKQKMSSFARADAGMCACIRHKDINHLLVFIFASQGRRHRAANTRLEFRRAQLEGILETGLNFLGG